MRERFETSWGFSFQIASHRLYREAMEAYMTDPSKADCIAEAINECIEKIGDCLDKPGAGGGGPDCPPGTQEVNGRCKVII